MTASPADSVGNSIVTTNFTLNYPDAAVVTLTAPNAVGRYRFQKWLKDGVAYESGLTAQVTMDANHTLKAMYVEVSPTFPADLRIMPLGDSITYGYNGGNAGYRGPLYTLLSPLALNFRYVGTSVERPGSLPLQPINQRYHEGHSSYNLQDICNNLDGLDSTRYLELGGPDRNPNGGYWLTGGNGTGRAAVFPDIITMMAGTNDMTIFPGAEGRLQALISKITTLRPNAKLLVAKITPIPSLTNDEAYNVIVSNVVAGFQAAGKKVYLVDLNTGFPVNGLDPDGVHPNDTGFNWVANKWFEAIVAAYSPATIARPFRVAPAPVPGQIEAEDFDLGGSGISYQDLSPANEGGLYRTDEGVDIEATGDSGGGYEIFHTQAGEWLKYTVMVESAGGYTPYLRIFNPTPGGEVYLEVDGVNVTNNVAIPQNNSWQTVTLPEIHLNGGEHVIRLGIFSTLPGDTAGAINWLSFTANAKTGPSARAGPDIEVIDLDGNGSEPVTLNGSTTIAGDSPSLTYTWLRGGVVIATGVNPTVTLPVGIQVIQLTVTDGNAQEATDDVLATVSPKPLLNGSFESGLTNWTTSGSLLIEGAAPYSPTDGTKLLTFNGGNQAPNGVLSQAVATAVGGTYTIAFDAGVVAFNASSQTIQVTVTGVSSLLSQTINLTNLGGGTNRWVPQSFTFVANSGRSTITFRDLSGSTTGIDMTLDNVRVTGPPASPVNTAPVATSDSYSTNESAALVVPTGGLLANDSDVDGNALVAVVNVRPLHGTLSLNLNGGFTYTPASGYFGNDSFTYHASDGFLSSSIVAVSLTINEVIPAPLAVPDSFSTSENIPLVVPARGVLTNDIDLRSRPLTVNVDTGPVHGSLGLNIDGSFVYTPDPGFFGTDSFTYHNRNGFLDSNIATANITVNEVIPPPLAVADAYATNESTALVIGASGVLANDSDPRFRLITAILDAGPSHGTLLLNANGNFTYTPAFGFFGSDSFTYHASNGFLDSGIVTVNLTVFEIIPPPVAVDDSYSTNEDLLLVVPAAGVLTNDSDPRLRPITAIVDVGPAHGSLTFQSNGSFTYKPVHNYYGPDSFTYYAYNGFRDSETVTVNLTVNEVIPPPVAEADAYATNENTALVVPATGVLANDVDPRSRPITAILDAGPSHGTLSLNANGNFTYTPTTSYFGPDSFTYHARNGFLNSSIVTVSLTVNEVIPPPVAVADSYVTNENVPLAIPAQGVLTNDSDPRSRPITAILNTGPSHGTLSLNVNGSFSYTPASGFYGIDSFNYHARNGFLNSNVVTVSIAVNEVIPPPVTVADSYVTNESTPLVVGSGGLLSNDSDPRSRALTAILNTGPVHGTLALNANGNFIYTPTTAYFGTDSFTYHANNGFLNSSVVTVAVLVKEVIPAPVATANSYSTNESTPLVVAASGVLANDMDTRARPLTAVLDAGPAHGMLTLNANGSFTYTPSSGFFGTDSFTYHARNGFVDSNIVTVNINVIEIIRPPVAAADSYATNESTALVVPAAGVLANDTDPRSRPLTALLNTGPSHGTLSLSSDGRFTYTPVSAYFGTDSFTYRTRNGFLVSNIATVTITINEVIPAPVAVANSYSTNESTVLIVPATGVLANDSDPRSRPLTAVLDTGPSHGNLTLNANGSFTYNPTGSYFGTDSFTYHARNGFRDSNVVTVTLAITEVIPPPVAVGNSYATTESIALVVPATGVLGNDSDPRSRPLTAVLNTGPGHGTLALNANGSFTFTPTTGYFGTDSFTYHARNGFLDSNIVTVSLVINEFIPAPVAVGDSYSTNESTPLVIPAAGVLGNDSDPRSRPITAVLNTGPGHGMLTLNSNGGFNYTPAAGFFGTDSFTYRAYNGFVASSIATVSLVVNEVIPAPLAVADSYSTNENVALTVAAAGVLANDSDPRSRPLTALLDAGPSHGSLSLNANGSFNYTPVAGYFGSDSFTYHARNGFLNSNIVTVNITVSEVIPPPVAAGDSYSTNESTALVVAAAGILANDSDPRSRPLTAILNAGPAHGTLSLNANGSFTFTPVAGYFGTDSFTYHARNGFLDSNVVTVNLTVNEVIPPPVAVGDSYSTSESTALVVAAAGVLANDTEPRSRPLTSILNAGPSHGSITLNTNGSFTYTPTTGYFGIDSFIYHCRNGFLDSNIVTVTITINEVIPPPVSAGDSYITNESTALTIPVAGVLANDTDPRSRPLTAISDTLPSHGTLSLSANGSFTYTPAAGYFGNDSFSYHARNGFLNSNSATVSLVINEVIPAPVAVADSYSTSENAALVVPAAGVLANDSDPRSRPLTALLDAGPSHGTLALNANGSFNYTPVAGYFGSDSFTYHARNGTVNSTIVNVNIAVNEVIPAPLAAADFYSTNYGTPLVVAVAGVLANDTDIRSRPLTAVINAGPGNGTLTLNANGSFTYTPAAGYSGTDSFTYHANNGTLDSNVVIVRLNVNPFVFAGLVNGSFESGFTGWTATGNQFIQSAAPYVPTDGTKLVGYNGADQTPNAVLSQSFSTTAGQTYTLAFDLGVLSFNTNSQTMQATVNGTGNLLTRTITINGLGGGTCRWLPQSFTFVANSTSSTLAFRDQSSSSLNLDMMLDNVRVTAPPPVSNTAPVGVSNSYSTNQNTALVIPAAGVLANDTDAQSQTLSAYLNTGSGHGTVVLNTNGAFTYTPNNGFSGNDSFTYFANDGALSSNAVTVSISVNGINTAPVAAADSYVTNQDTALVVPANGILANDTDAQSQALTAILNSGTSHGTLSLNANGGFTYTPTAGYFGSDSFTYHANDGTLNSEVVGVNLTINEVIAAPVAVADAYATNESTSLIVPIAGVLANDTDSGSRSLTAVLNASPSHGNITLNTNGSFTYTPINGYFGSDSFTYHANNGFLNSNIVTVSIAVNELIPPPVAAGDSYVTNESTALVVIAATGVLANDTDPRSRPLTAIINLNPSHGTLALNANGSFTYTPTTGYFGSDSFTYHANNGFLNSNIVSVGLTVNEVIPPPVAVADSYSTNESIALVVSASGVLANDSDPRSRPLTAVLNTGPGHGTLTLNANGSFTYTPTSGYFGPDSFTYRANNGFLNSNVVTASITVNEVIPPPVATADSYVANESTALGVAAAGVLANDTDPRSRPLTAILNASPAHGTLALNANGSFTYTPTAGYFGTDFFTYHARNGFLDSNIVSVGLTINEVIPPPVAVADSYSTNESTALVVAAAGVLANDNDPRSRPITASVNSNPGHGTLALNTNGSFTYTPTSGYFGPDSFTYHASNGSLNSNVVTVNLTVNEVIPPPAAAADAYSTNESTTLVVAAAGVLANDSDPRSRPLTAILNAGPGHGTLTLNTNGGFTYTPTTGYFGTDSFTYHATNGSLNSNIVTVNLTINEVIPPPIATADSYGTNESTALVVAAAGVLANDSDPRSRPLTAVPDAGPSHGTLALNSNGSFTYTPTTGYFGTDSFTYHTNNGSLNSNIATVNLTINEVIPPPIAAADSYATSESTALVVAAAGVLANDSDPRARPITAVLNTGPSHGALTLNPNGSFTYMPTTGYFGTDSFTYRASNGTLNSNAVTVSLTVNQVITGQLVNGSFESGFSGWTTSGNLFIESTAPYLANDGVKLAGFNGANTTPNGVISQSFATLVGTTYTLAFDAGIVSYNTNSQTLLVTVTGTGSLLSQTINIFGNGGGSAQWFPKSFTFTANSLTTTLTFRDQSTTTSGLDMVLDNVRTSTAPNTAPVAAADSYSTNQNTALVVSAAGLLANDTDAQSQALTAVLNSGPTHGTLSLNTSGGFTYTPATGYFGSDSFTYHANDGSLDSNIATVNLTIIQPNTAPVAAADSYSTNQDTALIVPAAGVLVNDTDAQSQPLTAAINAGPGHGAVTLNANGSFTYTPTAGYSGADSFTYHANDGLLDSNTATVSLTINPVVGLVNGSFESGFTGWTTTGNQVIQTATIYAPTNGTKLVGFNGANTAPNAVLSQSFATAPGQTCTLAFDAGVFAYNTNSQVLQVTVTGTNTLLTQTITIFGNGQGTSLWLAQSFNFVANSSSTTLTFRDLSATTQAIDLMLDNVRVTAASSIAPPVAGSGSTPETPGPLSLSGTPGDFTIRLTASKPGSYVLECSENLSQWEYVTTKQVTEPGPFEFHDTRIPITPQPRMFYRVGRQPAAQE
ncbi:Ig-like domain-containing protein [Luteolibacter sp.]|uniref:Ig-like domain-containing protein n=1 Tax=Luteolibacter sp. TaxID=1962973 RepID=UPI003264E410